MSPKSHNMEFVAIVDLDAEPCPERAEPIAAAILAEEEVALNAASARELAGKLSLA